MSKKTELPDKNEGLRWLMKELRANSADKPKQTKFESLLLDEISFQQKRRWNFLRSLSEAGITPDDIFGCRCVPGPVLLDIANDLRDFERNQSLRPCWLWG
ncbi:hypothetical protein [Ferrovum sp.]|jgi:hypothetical protein|uniref:hypothetical protein n=1 Tax=Ferrovum sp. TaxID=2609467 RepID=UPI0026263BB2|nr:hypothetical protein [Ferrovum sp.]